MASYAVASTANVISPKSVSLSSKPQGTCQEYSIKVPKTVKKKFHVMRFNSNVGVDFAKWKSQNIQIKMERENNIKEFKGTDEEIPKFGAGSEFGREAKEEARKKKYGIVPRKYKVEDQPWILKQGGKTGRKYRGAREGGVSDNTSYYVFTQAGNGIIEAYPLNEWYNFQPIQRYKSLTAEEAEQEFGRRHKVLNYFSLMMRKRLRNEDDDVVDDPDDKSKKMSAKRKNINELKISEMDDWVDSDDENSGSEKEEKKSDESDNEKKKKKKKDKKGPTKKKKKKDSDDEAFEESDDGDEEGRELDYISDSSESASDHDMKANKELKGVAEEDALRKLLNSESETEEEEEEKKDENESKSEEDEEKKESNDKDKEKSKEESSKKKKSKSSKKNKKSKSDVSKKSLPGLKDDGESSSELSPNSTDSDSDTNTKKKNSVVKNKDSANSAASSRSATPTPVTGEKRKATQAELAIAAAKKAKLDNGGPSSVNTSFSSNSGDTGVTEDAVRRYLMRKPMTTTELLHKFKSKKTGLSSEQLVNVMTQILKNINPVKQTIKNKMYLSIKPQ